MFLTRVLSLQDVFLRKMFYFVVINLSSGQGLQHLERLYESIHHTHFIFPNLGRLGLFYGNKTSSQFAAWRTTLHLPGELTDNILFNATCVNECCRSPLSLRDEVYFNFSFSISVLLGARFASIYIYISSSVIFAVHMRAKKKFILQMKNLLQM